jgi:anti-sigma regulatory factor (Ser/Thr protein kinase)
VGSDLTLAPTNQREEHATNPDNAPGTIITLTTSTQARHRTRRVLDLWHVAQPDIDMVELIVSELVTNAIRHGDTNDGEPPRLVLRLVSSEVVVEVFDASPVMPRVVAASEWDEAGRGLQLVEALASSWGATPVVVDGKQCGKRVWARVPVRITAGTGAHA